MHVGYGLGVCSDALNAKTKSRDNATMYEPVAGVMERVRKMSLKIQDELQNPQNVSVQHRPPVTIPETRGDFFLSAASHSPPQRKLKYLAKKAGRTPIILVAYPSNRPHFR